ncbi:MAG: flagellar biosynthetic protein FliO [Geminicoccaceae bacterium]|nr:flagellar biosynthetic protein FliO [Geminicoccaceae bacterium]MCX8101211.1 flagellar biosynthetic protein FliO [Geminicoccaceae bacterium]MDW8368954.1 flagellar biosynthetic protein FliO [Geminicoccaceae bacterium]
MEPIDLLRAAAALVAVLGLLGLAAWLLRRSGLNHRLGGAPGGRLAVVETRWLDPRTRLLLIRRDRIEHLVLLGAGPPLLVERGIAAPPAAESVR